SPSCWPEFQGLCNRIRNGTPEGIKAFAAETLYDGGSIPPLATSVFVLRTLRTGPKPSFCRTVMPDQTDSDQSSRHRTLTGFVECGDTVLNSSEASLNCMLECKSTTTALPNTELAIKTAKRLLATLPVVAILNADTSRDRLLYLGDSS